MRRMIALAALLLAPALAHAQQPPLQAQLDAAQATVSRIMVGMTGQIAADQAEIARLQAELAAAKKPAAKASPAP
jgi:hypothetical protein